ncbi:MAG: SH3 domain-containing protein [Nitrospirota bacterium]
MDEELAESINKDKKGPKRISKSRSRGSTSKEKNLLILELSEIKEIADLIFERIEKKIELLKEIEASVDEKIATLRRLGQERISAETPVHNIDHRLKILALKKEGLRNDEIANILNMPVGEVDLILNLNKNYEIPVGDTHVPPQKQQNFSQKLIKNKTRHTFFSRKIVWVLLILLLFIGFVSVYTEIPYNIIPREPKNIEQNLKLEKQENIEKEKLPSADLIRQKYALSNTQEIGLVETLQKNLQEEKSRTFSPELQKESKRIKVISNSATLRAEPSLDSHPVTWTSQGVVFDVLEEFTDNTGKKWYKVAISKGKECWIADKVVKQTS